MSQPALASFALACPHCDHPNPASSSQAGSDSHAGSHSRTVERIVDCVGCGRSFTRPAETPSASSTHPAAGSLLSHAQAQTSPVWEPPNPTATNLGLAVSGAAAAAATAIFYLAVGLTVRDTYFGALFMARGWVPYAIAFLSAWSLVILISKYQQLARQNRALELDLLPRSLSDHIRPENSQLFASHLRQVASTRDARGDDFLIARIRRALQHFRARGVAQEVVDQLGNLARSDAENVESSYTMLRTFIWAIPILGFIGTVVGIGDAVSGFSDSVSTAASLEVMKQSIGMVTTGLGVAFDTTLLALVMSIFIMLPTSSLEKAEGDFLARVDDYCDEHLVRRLEDEKLALHPAHAPAASTALEPGPLELSDELRALTTAIGELNRRLTEPAQEIDRAEER